MNIFKKSFARDKIKKRLRTRTNRWVEWRLFDTKEFTFFKEDILKFYFEIQFKIQNVHCVKSVRSRNYSGPYFPAFRLNTERYSASLRIQSECGKMRTRITPNTETFHAVATMS